VNRRLLWRRGLRLSVTAVFGYEGGRWDHDRFFYNTSVNNVNITNIHNTYHTTVINNNTILIGSATTAALAE